MISALVLPRPGAASPPLADDLQAAGIVVLGSSTRHSLVQDCIRQAPTLLVAHEPWPDDALFTALQALHDHAPLPVLLFSDDGDAGTMERALAAGVHGYELGAYAATRLRPLVQLTLLRFRREHALREQLGDVTQRFEERKLVDRAKGILMSLRGMGEDEAFKVLRGIAMQSGQRIGDVARQVMASARSAADVNRSGQLRMLSQRIVKLQALRQHKPQAEAATTQLRDAVEHLDTLLAALSKDLSAASFGDLLAAQRNSWQALQSALARDAALADIDTLAEQLLRQSDALTGALEAAGAVPTLQVVNVAGRQRMLSQRAAKLALLGQATELAATCTQFEHAMALLHATPLSSGEIRDALAAVDAQWLQLRQGIAAVATARGRGTLATASEALLAELDRLTGLYERSMQVLVG
ncbi:MAG: ANTAR domain-containing protein [Rubrivivax sp.]